jgi:hypothetical protein
MAERLLNIDSANFKSDSRVLMNLLLIIVLSVACGLAAPPCFGDGSFLHPLSSQSRLHNLSFTIANSAKFFPRFLSFYVIPVRRHSRHSDNYSISLAIGCRQSSTSVLNRTYDSPSAEIEVFRDFWFGPASVDVDQAVLSGVLFKVTSASAFRFYLDVGLRVVFFALSLFMTISFVCRSGIWALAQWLSLLLAIANLLASEPTSYAVAASRESGACAFEGVSECLFQSVFWMVAVVLPETVAPARSRLRGVVAAAAVALAVAIFARRTVAGIAGAVTAIGICRAMLRAAAPRDGYRVRVYAGVVGAAAAIFGMQQWGIAWFGVTDGNAVHLVLGVVARNVFVFAMMYFHWTCDLRMKDADDGIENWTRDSMSGSDGAAAVRSLRGSTKFEPVTSHET